jgi:hypothetical protein
VSWKFWGKDRSLRPKDAILSDIIGLRLYAMAELPIWERISLDPGLVAEQRKTTHLVLSKGFLHDFLCTGMDQNLVSLRA